MDGCPTRINGRYTRWCYHGYLFRGFRTKLVQKSRFSRAGLSGDKYIPAGIGDKFLRTFIWREVGHFFHYL